MAIIANATAANFQDPDLKRLPTPTNALDNLGLNAIRFPE
jgi:hypothetical protein